MLLKRLECLGQAVCMRGTHAPARRRICRSLDGGLWRSDNFYLVILSRVRYLVIWYGAVILHQSKVSCSGQSNLFKSAVTFLHAYEW